MITIQKSQLSVMNIQYRYFSLDKFLDDAVGNGVSNIELWGAMPFFNIEDMTYQEVKEVRHQIESRGLKLVCLTPEQCVYPVNLAAPSEAARRRSLKFFEDNIRAASELGTDKMLVTTGYGFFDESNHEEAWKWARDGIYDLAELAKIHGITLALEVLRRDESNLVYNLPTLSQMLDELKHDSVGGMIDTIPMALAGERPADYLQALGDLCMFILLTEHPEDILHGGTEYWICRDIWRSFPDIIIKDICLWKLQMADIIWIRHNPCGRALMPCIKF